MVFCRCWALIPWCDGLTRFLFQREMRVYELPFLKNVLNETLVVNQDLVLNRLIRLNDFTEISIFQLLFEEHFDNVVQFSLGNEAVSLSVYFFDHPVHLMQLVVSKEEQNEFSLTYRRKVLLLSIHLPCKASCIDCIIIWVVFVSIDYLIRPVLQHIYFQVIETSDI